jgi:hypothetical protein
VSDQLRFLDQLRADELELADRIEREAATCRHGRYATQCPLCALDAEWTSTAATRGAAERQIQPTAANLRDQVLAYVRAHGPCCDERIAEGLKMNPNTERPRRLELERAGRIVASGIQTTRSGRRAVSWVAKFPDDF